MAVYFTTLCSIQLSLIGPLMVIFGIIDRRYLQIQQSFLMLPIWTGLLVGIAGYSGLCVGRQNKRHGSVDVNAVSAVRAVNTMCIGLSFLTFYMYGQVLAFIGWDQTIQAEMKIKVPISAELKLPPEIKVKVYTIQGVLSVIMILSLLEMFVGAWLALLEKQQMFFGTPPRQDRKLLVANEEPQPQCCPVNSGA